MTFDGVEEWGDKSWMSNEEMPKQQDMGVSTFRAWLPYVVIAVILIITRISGFGIKAILNNDPFILHINNIFGFENISWNFKYLWNAGWFPFIPIALLCLLYYRVPKERCKTAFVTTGKQIAGAVVALLFGVAMVNLYRYTCNAAVGATAVVNADVTEFTSANSSMLFMMASALATLFNKVYFIIAPLIGVLGSFMSGSCTVSNTLFSPLQFETAKLAGLPPVLIVALQNMGGAIGNMVCVNNVVAACATTYTSGNEGKIIRINIIPCLIYAVIVAIVVGILLAVGFDPMPELLAALH